MHSMSNKIERELSKIESAINRHADGFAKGQIAEIIDFTIEDKTLQRRLATLVDAGRILRKGQRKAARYYPAESLSSPIKGQKELLSDSIFSKSSQSVLKFLEKPVYSRPSVSYKRSFLDDYIPNETIYVPKPLREQLLAQGVRFDTELAAGTYARQICQRLLIDLSYNSSRLEGNTYSQLDTQKLLEEGITAEGKIHEETVMIMNHKEAILFLVENAQDVELNSLTVRNLHNMLAQDLLANPEACGNIRSIEVNIGKSTYRPLANSHQLRELFELMLLKARQIEDPFEQSFFLLVHLSYLQAFEDVNKRTSRLSCNIPFIKKNLCPLSFVDVSREDYTAALLAIYELNDIAPMLELYQWAYLRSCQQYAVARQSIGEIDTFRIQYRQQRKDVMGEVVRQKLHGQDAEALIASFCAKAEIDNTDKFIAMALADLDALHAGAIIGLGITEAQLEEWQKMK